MLFVVRRGSSFEDSFFCCGGWKMTTGISAKRFSEFFGTLFLCAAGVLAVLIFVDRWTDINFPFPSFWYTSRNFHLACCVTLCILGWLSHRNASALPQPHDAAAPAFHSVAVYTKPDCPLCDRAFETLSEFSPSLPVVEKIDITGHTDLENQYSQCVPVVVIDGRVRFRGVVSPALLKRMIDVRRRQQQVDESAANDPHGQDG